MTISDAAGLIFKVGDGELISVTVTQNAPFAVGYTLKRAGSVAGAGHLTSGHTYSFSVTSADTFASLLLTYLYPAPDYGGSYSVTITGSLGGDVFTSQVPGGVPVIANTFTFTVGE